MNRRQTAAGFGVIAATCAWVADSHPAPGVRQVATLLAVLFFSLFMLCLTPDSES